MVSEENKTFTENFMTALWYNGFSNEVNELLLYLKSRPIGKVIWPERRIGDKYGDNYPIKMLWNTLVLMYGDFSVSPDTSGHITDIDGAIQFIEDYREFWGAVETFRD